MVPCYPVSVKALIERDGKFFFILKKRNGSIFYGLPGGLKEPGETLEEALKREVKEETGWDVEVVYILGANRYIHPSGNEDVAVYYSAKIAGGEFRLRGEKNVEFVGYKWLSPEEFHVLWPDEYRELLARMAKKVIEKKK